MSASWWRKVLMALVLGAFSLSAQGQLEEITGEGFDRQSDEEIERARKNIEDLGFDFNDQPVTNKAMALKILDQYKHLDPKREIPTDLLEKTVLYFEANKSRFTNQNYFTIVDFRPRSNTWRFYLVDLRSGAVERYHTTHGIGSDKDKNGYAEVFGNVPNSGKSSLGFIRVGEVYSGKFGRSVRLDGLSETNSNVRKRAIVVHGWDKVKEDHVIQGLSWGCVTLDWKVKDAVIDKIAEGSLLYIGQAARK